VILVLGRGGGAEAFTVVADSVGEVLGEGFFLRDSFLRDSFLRDIYGSREFVLITADMKKAEPGAPPDCRIDG
jgi:hypothetical protein